MKNMEQYKPIKFLEGRRIYLRPIEDEDLDLFYSTLGIRKEEN